VVKLLTVVLRPRVSTSWVLIPAQDLLTACKTLGIFGIALDTPAHHHGKARKRIGPAWPASLFRRGHHHRRERQALNWGPTRRAGANAGHTGKPSAVARIKAGTPRPATAQEQEPPAIISPTPPGLVRIERQHGLPGRRDLGLLLKRLLKAQAGARSSRRLHPGSPSGLAEALPTGAQQSRAPGFLKGAPSGTDTKPATSR